MTLRLTLCSDPLAPVLAAMIIYEKVSRWRYVDETELSLGSHHIIGFLQRNDLSVKRGTCFALLVVLGRSSFEIVFCPTVRKRVG